MSLKYVCIVLLLPFIEASFLDLFGSNNKGPRIEEGECSKGDESYYTGPYYYSQLRTGQMYYTTNRLTAVHRTLPPGSFARVTNEYNNRSVVVEIVGVGPTVEGRIMELSPAAFCQISREPVMSCFVRATNERPPQTQQLQTGMECQTYGSEYDSGYPAPPSYQSSSNIYPSQSDPQQQQQNNFPSQGIPHGRIPTYS